MENFKRSVEGSTNQLMLCNKPREKASCLYLLKKAITRWSINYSNFSNLVYITKNRRYLLWQWNFMLNVLYFRFIIKNQKITSLNIKHKKVLLPLLLPLKFTAGLKCFQVKILSERTFDKIGPRIHPNMVAIMKNTQIGQNCAIKIIHTMIGLKWLQGYILYS